MRLRSARLVTHFTLDYVKLFVRLCGQMESILTRRNAFRVIDAGLANVDLAFSSSREYNDRFAWPRANYISQMRYTFKRHLRLPQFPAG